MEVEIIKVKEKLADNELIQAIRYLEQEKTVVFPTDTVYGIGADLFKEKAVKNLFEIKKRPLDKPINALVSSMKQVEMIVENIPDSAIKLIKEFWPGGLTIILKKKDIVPDIVTAGRETIGVRKPNNEIILQILEKFGKPLAATSANISGLSSPITAKEVLEQLGEKSYLLIDGGKTIEKQPSTIIDLSSKKPQILRKGSVSVEKIKEILPSIIE
ncbi:MAG: threonylcarbamoyl-AMP synthase [Candidatus Heimdallarchaeum endolithica]|uniref:L-threonylcarbamoyladenylate synthase n=1 Tax=Candidatus Heimdallarchaeum endolithica TaxID=2876572 RepID=A0A9Y1FPI2_9ARCH|nr:MAG: threonylcarbamoyl-AMP synthase [Candidatus Heimdallarchaeum endolithica]